ncbi:MAG: chorismate synthase [Sphingobacteriales bacterium]|nr:chorismate synthase [Sphingobacteriales bacterium]
MAGNSFGELFRITTFGESHGPLIGVTIDGCPPDLHFNFELLKTALSRRRPGQSDVTSSRNEPDIPEVVSGIFDGKTTGAPITILIKNTDSKSEDYQQYAGLFRPSHAEFSYWKKYGHFDYRGGGRSSARETAARVAAGAVAKMLLSKYQINVIAFTFSIGYLSLENLSENISENQVEESLVRCPDKDLTEKMHQLIEEAKKQGDSLGGVIGCFIKNCPAGLGEPVFDRFEADLAKAMLSINATKGFEIGDGFRSAQMKGSENNDYFGLNEKGEVVLLSNHAGGVLGGITTGADIFFKVAFKPVSTIQQNQVFYSREGEKVILENKPGRHDPCVIPRAVPVVEAMAAIVTADHFLRQKSLCG